MNITALEMPSAFERPADVPCGKCRLCCQGRSAVMVLPDHGDDVSSYETAPLPGMGDALFLKLQPNGDCIYLGETGCTIHGRAPFMCRIYDCREQHRMYTKEQRDHLVKRGMLNAEILRRGAILIHQQRKSA